MSGREAETRLRPFWGRVLVVESPVDEDQTRSGLILPQTLSDDVKRGVVTEIDEEYDHELYAANRAALRCIERGAVVFFRTRGANGEAVKIGDAYVVDLAMILAYET